MEAPSGPLLLIPLTARGPGHDQLPSGLSGARAAGAALLLRGYARLVLVRVPEPRHKGRS